MTTENVIFEGTTTELAELLSLDPDLFGALRENVTLGDLVGLAAQEHLEPQLP